MALAYRLAPAAAAAAARRRLPVLCRAASTKAAAADAAEPAAASPYSFQHAATEPAAFTELFEPGRRAVLLAVDPDLNGALVALSWRNPAAGQAGSSSNGSNASSSNGSSREPSSRANSSSSGPGSHGLPLPPSCRLQVELHDMPVEVWQYGSRAKRQPAASGLIGILQRYAAVPGEGAAGTAGAAAAGAAGDAAAAAAADGVRVTVVGGKEAKPKKRSSSTKKKGKGKAAKGDAAEDDPAAAAAATADDGAAAAEPLAAQGAADAAAVEADPPIVRAVMEYNMPAQLSGKFAWYGIGFASGLLNGLLVGAGIPYQRVHASSWKAGMGLRKQGKEGSIALAGHLLPAAVPLLKRKKDHGRAEALLLAAYALGVRMQPLGGDSKTAEAAADEEEEDSSEGSVDEEEDD